MLWHVDGTNLHLLGTVHISDEPLVLSDRMEAAIQEAQIVAFETDFHLKPVRDVGLQKKGRQLSQSISSDLLSATKAELAELGCEVQLETRQPWSIALEIINRRMASWGFSQPGIDPAVRARCAGKSLFFLESIEAGFNAFASAPTEEQERFLDAAINRQAEGRVTVGRLVRGWRTSDIPDLTAVSDEQHELLPAMMSKLLGGRNAKWLPHILRLARSNKSVVVAIGELHLVGRGNLLEMLEASGFACSPAA